MRVQMSGTYPPECLTVLHSLKISVSGTHRDAEFLPTELTAK